MNTKKHEDIAAELIAGKQGGIRLLKVLRSRSEYGYTFYVEDGVALLSVINEGRTASLLTSIPSSGVEAKALQALLGQSISELSRHRVTLAQIVLNDPAPKLQMHAIIEAGFEELAKLRYLERQTSVAIPCQPNETKHIGLHFHSMETNSDVELGKVLEETYIGSLDCPNLYGVRPIQDIIDGHRMSSLYQPDFWFIGTIDESPVCVLLLNPNDDVLELAYIGVIPSQREHGIADFCLAKTIELAQHHNFQRITLVVDNENAKASKLYAKWDFAQIQSRHAFMYKLC